MRSLSPAERAIWGLGAAVVFLFLAMAVAVTLLKLDSLNKDKQIRATAKQASILAKQTKKQSQGTHDALCQFRLDIQRRHDSTKKILRETPIVFMRLGFTKAQIRKALHDQESVLDTLDNLHCPSAVILTK